jgi:hypothetical protein
MRRLAALKRRVRGVRERVVVMGIGVTAVVVSDDKRGRARAEKRPKRVLGTAKVRKSDSVKAQRRVRRWERGWRCLRRGEGFLMDMAAVAR